MAGNYRVPPWSVLSLSTASVAEVPLPDHSKPPATQWPYTHHHGREAAGPALGRPLRRYQDGSGPCLTQPLASVPSPRSFQASLLPDNAFDLEHLDVASYYRAGVQGTQVGGDWYDVISLRDGLHRVAGRRRDGPGRPGRGGDGTALVPPCGPYARLGLLPDELMTALDESGARAVPGADRDRHLRSVRPGGLGRPAGQRRTRACAGDPRDGSCSLLATEAHPPLGMGFPFEPVHSVELHPGDGVPLYTDGRSSGAGRALSGSRVVRVAVGTSSVPSASSPARRGTSCSSSTSSPHSSCTSGTWATGRPGCRRPRCCSRSPSGRPARATAGSCAPSSPSTRTPRA